MEPNQYVDILFDEIEDLNRDLISKKKQVERLILLIEKQDLVMDRSVKFLEIKSKNYSKLKKVLQSSFELLDRSERLFTKEDSNKKIDGLFLRSQKVLTQADSKISDLSTQNVLLKKLFDDLCALHQNYQ